MALFSLFKNIFNLKDMKKLSFIILSVITTLCSFVLFSNYDPKFVEISSVSDGGYTYNFVYMNRGSSKNRIKAKYFASKSNGATVSTRYNSWSQNKNMIVVSSAGYMDNCYDQSASPVGLTIDNGIVVNRNLASFDGLLIVYATGGIVATDLRKGDLTLQGSGITQGRKFNIRNSWTDRNDFIKWAQQHEATVFQTHLLIYKDQLAIGKNAPSDPRERRFLAVGKDKISGDLCHVVINLPEYSSLYNGASRTKKFLNDTGNMEITFMINLDTGCQDVCTLYNRDGSINTLIKGQSLLGNAVNLLAYYYE